MQEAMTAYRQINRSKATLFIFTGRGDVFLIEKPLVIEPLSSPDTPLPRTAKPYTENPDMGIPDTENTAQ